MPHKDQKIFPKCLLKENPKISYISHDGYARPCCLLHRHNKVEADEPWLLDSKHNIASGTKFSEIFNTSEYKDFFERLRTGRQVPQRCIDVCGVSDDRRVRIVDGKRTNARDEFDSLDPEFYETEFLATNRLQIDVTHRCRLGCPKCCRFDANVTDPSTGKIYELGHQMLTKTELSVADFEKLFAEAEKTRRIELVDFTGTWSDCIYHPNFLEIVEVIKRYNCQINICTNGSGKTTEWWHKLYSMLHPEYDSIVFGMDGIKDTADVYRKYIIYNQVIEAMTIGSELGFKCNRWSFIVFNFNQHQIEEAMQIAKDIGIDFEIVKSHRWTGPNDPWMPSKEWLPGYIIKKYNL